MYSFQNKFTLSRSPCTDAIPILYRNPLFYFCALAEIEQLNLKMDSLGIIKGINKLNIGHLLREPNTYMNFYRPLNFLKTNAGIRYSHTDCSICCNSGTL